MDTKYKLKEFLHTHTRDHANALDPKECDVAIFGAGNTSVLYQNCFDFEFDFDFVFLDNNPKKQDTLFQGKKVLAPSDFFNRKSEKQKLVFICSANIKFCKEIRAYLSDFIDLRYVYHVDEYVFTKRQNEILKVIDFLEDDFSKQVYAEMIIARIKCEAFPETIYNPTPYFCLPQFIYSASDSVFVDCGGYVGDTVEDYIRINGGMFSKIVSFEPNLCNYNAFMIRRKRLLEEWALSEDKIIVERAGVGQKTEFLSFVSSSASGAALGASFMNQNGDQSESMRIFSLDDYFKEQKVSFLKADIESFELNLLKGSVNIIHRDEPVLAICIYHNALDMWQIPLWLKENLPNYVFKVCQHSYQLLDTVFYAYPKG